MLRRMNPEWLIEHLRMKAHPEGGHYAETHRAAASGGERGAVTCIYFMLQRGEVSAWHRIDATEVWHFAAGAPLTLSIRSDGAQTHHTTLGSDLSMGQEPHWVVPPYAWQSARSLGDWTLVSCIVAPAFMFEGFELEGKSVG